MLDQFPNRDIIRPRKCGCSSVVERNLAKVDVARSNRVTRSSFEKQAGFWTPQPLKRRMFVWSKRSAIEESDAWESRFRDRPNLHPVITGIPGKPTILVEVYCELTGGRQRSLLFANEPVLTGASLRAGASPVGPRPARIPLIRPEEAAAHAAHIRPMGEGAIWLRFGLALA